MEKESVYLVLSRDEARHIMWNHAGLPAVDDLERARITDLINELAESISSTVEHDRNEVRLINYPGSREFLVRRILRINTVDANPPTA